MLFSKRTMKVKIIQIQKRIARMYLITMKKYIKIPNLNIISVEMKQAMKILVQIWIQYQLSLQEDIQPVHQNTILI
jgi:hypothetical protein